MLYVCVWWCDDCYGWGWCESVWNEWKYWDVCGWDDGDVYGDVYGEDDLNCGWDFGVNGDEMCCWWCCELVVSDWIVIGVGVGGDEWMVDDVWRVWEWRDGDEDVGDECERAVEDVVEVVWGDEFGGKGGDEWEEVVWDVGDVGVRDDEVGGDGEYIARDGEIFERGA